MKPAVLQAIAEFQAQFGAPRVQAVELPDGSARLVILSVELGPPYQQVESWFGFTLAPLYPYADVYPHFVRPDLCRLDGKPLQAPVHVGNNFYGEPAVMVSRRTRLTGPSNANSALLKLLKVQKWLREPSQ